MYILLFKAYTQCMHSKNTPWTSASASHNKIAVFNSHLNQFTHNHETFPLEVRMFEWGSSVHQRFLSNVINVSSNRAKVWYHSFCYCHSVIDKGSLSYPTKHMFCCGYMTADFTHIFQVTLLALGQAYYCPNVSEATLEVMCKLGRYMWPLLLTWFNFNPSMDK